MDSSWCEQVVGGERLAVRGGAGIPAPRPWLPGPGSARHTPHQYSRE
jgi:hypothetical protein